MINILTNMKRKDYNSLRQETHENAKLETTSYKDLSYKTDNSLEETS